MRISKIMHTCRIWRCVR